jgi:hypothetical protein
MGRRRRLGSSRLGSNGSERGLSSSNLHELSGTSVALAISALSRRTYSRALISLLAEPTMCGLFCFAVVALTGLPYAYGYASAPADKQFMGILLDVPDTAGYLAWAHEFAHKVLIENTLTPERGEPLFFNLFWLAVGRAAAALGIGLTEAMQGARVISGVIFLGSIYWLVGLVSPDRLHRWVTFLVVTLGGGLGWMLVAAKPITGSLLYPLDVQVVEPNTFLTVMGFPHQAMAGALVVLALGMGILAFERKSIPLGLAAGFAGVLLGVQHGYDLLIIYTVISGIALTLALQRREWFTTAGLWAAICLPSVPVAGYLAYLTHDSPIWRAVLSQYGNAGVYTPTPPHLLIVMGLPLVVLLVVKHAPPKDQGETSTRDLLLQSWLVVGFALLYIPTDFQIKMLAGWQIPVGVMATRAILDGVVPALGASRRLRSQLVLGALLVIAVVPVNAYLFAWRIVDFTRHDYPYYLNRDDIAALGWLEQHSEPTDIVLSSLTIGQFVPSVSGNRTFLGHWAQTVDFYRKRQMVAAFFSEGQADTQRAGVLDRYGFRYVFYGEPERELGRFDPAGSPLFTKVFTTPHTQVYRVAPPPHPGEGVE